MIFIQLSQQLRSLSDLLSLLDDRQYNKKIAHLGNASIGAHTRHIIELLQCAITGYEIGQIDYINRSRDIQLETDRIFARSILHQLDNTIKHPDKQLALVVEQIEGCTELSNVTTTYFREIVYNSEHTIHHLALIKVAIIEMKLELVDDTFGMAYSTIKYRESLKAS
ncbi:MAG TPA: hypothetical protein VK559_10950 [Ferruginibacter sp.]|nr:hypothetical protein [Ferruginibacter sp.]